MDGQTGGWTGFGGPYQGLGIGIDKSIVLGLVVFLL